MITPEQARKVKLLGLDVDGVLTDNAVWIGRLGEQRIELKRFDISDGLGLMLLRQSGIDVAWISGRQSEATALRAKELRVETVIQVEGARKLEAVEGLLAEKGFTWEELAFVGDDLADLPVLKRAGLPIAVANGCAEVKAVCSWVTRGVGGQGAVREVVEALLGARGDWDSAVAGYLRDRGDPSA